MSKIVGDSACPSCRSHGRDKTGNHLIHFDTGWKYCNRCGYKEAPEGYTKQEEYSKLNIEDVLKFTQQAIVPRMLGLPCVEHYNVRIALSEETGEPDEVYFPVYTTDETLIGWKARKYEGKKFLPSVGTWKGKEVMLFGQMQCPKSGNKLLITEGEYDAMAAWQMAKEKYPQYDPCVVSVPNGASAAERDVAANLSFIAGFNEIILGFDQDEAGRAAAAKVASLIGNKAKIMRW